MLDQDRRDGFKAGTFFLVGHRGFVLGGVKHFQESPDIRFILRPSLRD
jgi:hypothetical protein